MALVPELHTAAGSTFPVSQAGLVVNSAAEPTKERRGGGVSHSDRRGRLHDADRKDTGSLTGNDSVSPWSCWLRADVSPSFPPRLIHRGFSMQNAHGRID